MKRRITCLLLALCMIAALFPVMQARATDMHAPSDPATGTPADQDDPSTLVANGIAHGLAYLENQSINEYGDEWNIFTILRAGGSISTEDASAYLESVRAAVNTGLSQPTDYARVILTLGVMGEDPTDLGGVNLVEQLYNLAGINKMTSNMICWTLLALDSKNYEVPEDAVNTRAKLIDWLLTFQTADGGFCLSGSSTSVDMTGMILQALAPYNSENFPAVQTAFAKAVSWLKSQMGAAAGFADGSAYKENCCTTAQVLIALSAAGINALDPDNGFTVCQYNLVTNLWSYRAPSGFRWVLDSEAVGSTIGTQQTTNALEAYKRFAAGANALYDLTDVAINDNNDYQEKLTALVAQAEALNQSDYSEASWSTVAQKLQIARTLLMSGSTDQEQLKEAAENLQSAMDALVKQADLDAANAFIAKVDALPSADSITENYKDTVTALLEEYEGFSKTVKSYIPEAYITKLNACNDKIATLKPIKVTISVLGDSHHDSDSDGQIHTLKNGGLTTWIAPTEYSVKSGATVKDVLEMALSAHNMTWSNPKGNYVKSINGLEEFDNGNCSGWMFTLNGYHPSLSVDVQPVKDGDVIVFHYTDDYNRESNGGGDDDDENAAIQEVIKKIDAIGTVSYTDTSKQKIDAARRAYDALSFADKKQITNYATLEAAEKAYADLKKADDQKKADAVDVLIGKIDAVVTLESEPEITAARDAYNKLTPDQQALIENYRKLANAESTLAELKTDDADKKNAQEVIDMIEKLGKITEASVDVVKEARAAYDGLTDVQKALVTNYEKLEAAEAVLLRLKDLGAYRDIYRETGDFLAKQALSADSQWIALGLLRSGREVEDNFYEALVEDIAQNIDEDDRLHKTKSTDNAKMILVLTAMGIDAADVEGFNLVAGLNSMDYIRKQGINGPVFALIALDSGNYPAPAGDVTRETLIQTILDAQLADGGWSLSGEDADSDMTAMALQALAPYYVRFTPSALSSANSQGLALQLLRNATTTPAKVECLSVDTMRNEIVAAVNRGIATLSALQNRDGSYSTVGAVTSESVSQVIVALSALGIDADDDSRFIKNGTSALDALLAFYTDGGFKHAMDGQKDNIATEQGYYALTAYDRFLRGMTPLYDMTDVLDMGGDVDAPTQPEATEPDQTVPSVSADDTRGSFPWRILTVIVIVAVGGIVIVGMLSRKKARKTSKYMK